ncbi:MAG: TonB-dependent receptor [Bacteroidales bacterium]|nr:TonB-dependent receptor [Bacteroidales bacterium]
MKKLILFAATLLCGVHLWAQSYTISGTIIDRSTGETLIGATVVDLLSKQGTVTNVNGRYSLTLRADSVEIRFSYVGYEPQFKTFRLNENKEINISLDNATNLQTVNIVADRINSPRSSQMSAIDIPIEHLKAVPVIFGETDIIKAIQLLPGVQSGGEGQAGMYVRGGGPDENLFLLDGVPLYNVNHLGGFFSAFNSDAVKNVTLYKGSFPARFGGRLSSVLDVATNNGNDKEIHGGINVGDIAIKAFLEGPIIKEKTTFSISARRTYFDALIQPFLQFTRAEGIVTSAGYYFYDFNAKVTHKFNDRSRLFLSYYMGDDIVYARVKTSERYTAQYDERNFIRLKYNWGNIVGSARWNYVINPKLFMNVTGSYTRYRNDIGLTLEEEYWNSSGNVYSGQMGMGYNSGIHDYTLRTDFDYAPNPNHSIKFGGSATYHLFSPETMSMSMHESQTGSTYEDDYNIDFDTIVGESKVNATELNLFFEDDWKINDAIKVNAGLAMSGFAVQNTFYPSIQPRFSGRILLTDELSLKAGYAYTTQYLHLLSNSTISLPTDLWVPVTAKIPPMHAHQVAAGLAYNFRYLFDISIEGYYKHMNNLMEYKDGASFFGNSVGWEDKVCLGEGWAYGVEFLLQRTVGKFTGWLGYTWSHADRLFDRHGMELSNGQVFPAKYDRRHDISIVAMYKFNDKWEASASWVYMTGNTATLALQTYEGESHSSNTWYDEYAMTVPLNYIEGRNNFRMPAYHRMDLSVSYHKQKKHGIATWNVSIYNLYNRQNPYLIYASNRFHYTYNGTRYQSALVQLSIFPIIPSISYNFKF